MVGIQPGNPDEVTVFLNSHKAYIIKDKGKQNTIKLLWIKLKILRMILHPETA